MKKKFTERIKDFFTGGSESQKNLPEKEVVRGSMDDYLKQRDSMRDIGREGEIGSEFCHKLNSVLTKYQGEKAVLDNKVREANEWYMHRHWDLVKQLTIDTKKAPEPTTAWLFNSICNKHADAMDSYPESRFYPRSRDDEKVASQLNSVIETMKDECKYYKVYWKKWWDKLITGTGITRVTWDFQKNCGIGGIDIANISILKLYWKMTADNIQKSPYVFEIEIADRDELIMEYPFLEDKAIGKVIAPAEFDSEDSTSQENDVAVIHAWYKRKGVVHYCKYVSDTVIYASENDPRFKEKGYYFRGEFPYHIDVLYPVMDRIAGIGYIDLFKSCQMYIDKMEQAMLENTIANSKPRIILSRAAGINEKELCDINKTVVFADNLSERSFMELKTSQLSGASFSMLDRKVNELKETSANRDFGQGSTSGGVTSGTGIMALQESGNKNSRDMIDMSYQIEQEQDAQIIDLIRQFMALPQYYRILGEDQMNVEYIAFDNTGLLPQKQRDDADNIYYKLPIFDIKIKAQKKSPFTTLEGNERCMNMYAAGMFNPQNTDQAIAAIEGMTFEGKDEMLQRIKKNGTMYDMLMQMQSELQRLQAENMQLRGVSIGMPTTAQVSGGGISV